MMNRILTESNPDLFLGCLCLVKREVYNGRLGNYRGTDIIIPLKHRRDSRAYADCIVWHRYYSDDQDSPHIDRGFTVRVDELELLTSDEMIPTESVKHLLTMMNRIDLSRNNRDTTHKKLCRLLRKFYGQ